MKKVAQKQDVRNEVKMALVRGLGAIVRRFSKRTNRRYPGSGVFVLALSVHRKARPAVPRRNPAA